MVCDRLHKYSIMWNIEFTFIQSVPAVVLRVRCIIYVHDTGDLTPGTAT